MKKSVKTLTATFPWRKFVFEKRLLCRWTSDVVECPFPVASEATVKNLFPEVKRRANFSSCRVFPVESKIGMRGNPVGEDANCRRVHLIPGFCSDFPLNASQAFHPFEVNDFVWEV